MVTHSRGECVVTLLTLSKSNANRVYAYGLQANHVPMMSEPPPLSLTACWTSSICSNCVSELLAAPVRSRYDIEQDYIKQWKEVTARDNEPKKVTPLSFLWFVPVFVKYHVIPGPVRYVWWLVWSAFLRARYQIRKRLVLQGQSLLFPCSPCTIDSYC